ncbi:MAG: NUDIX domain-containing protein [Actinocrinis sp.]
MNEDIEVWDRVAGRVLLLDPEGRVLLFRGSDPARPDWFQWFTPGGGTEAGENVRDAAARELREDPGMHVDPGLYVDATALGREFFRGPAEFRGAQA